MPQASESIDVGDMWSEQERIRLQEAWEEEQKRVARKQRLKQRLTGGKAGSAPVDGKAPNVGSAASKKPEEPKEITLNISLPQVPKISVPHIAFPSFSKKQILIVGSVIVVLGGGVGGYMVYKDRTQKPVVAAGTKTTADSDGVKVEHPDPSQLKGTPEYNTVLPAGKKIEDFGGWVRISPQDKEAVYAYADKIDGVLINVSEQPLPDTFKANPTASMENLAKQFSVNDKAVADDMTLYIGTSAKGPQSVLFIKDDLLILIKSASKIKNDQWVAYVKTLQ
jgi:hypothetical protein